MNTNRPYFVFMGWRAVAVKCQQIDVDELDITNAIHLFIIPSLLSKSVNIPISGLCGNGWLSQIATWEHTPHTYITIIVFDVTKSISLLTDRTIQHAISSFLKHQYIKMNDITWQINVTHAFFIIGASTHNTVFSNFPCIGIDTFTLFWKFVIKKLRKLRSIAWYFIFFLYEKPHVYLFMVNTSLLYVWSLFKFIWSTICFLVSKLLLSRVKYVFNIKYR